MDNLIYDRTAANKGRPDVATLNRIESWTDYLAEQLRAYGYTITVSTRAWAMTDFPTRAEIDRIRANIDALQTGFYSLPDWRDIVYNNTLDFNQCNAFEWDLQAIDVWLGRMVAAFMHSGEIYSGEV